MFYKPQHIPVLLDEVLSALSINNNELYVDATFGLGGYTKYILNKKNCKVVAIDRDPESKIYAEKLSIDFKDRFYFKNGRFSQLTKILNELKIKNVAGIVFDLGVSSPQFDQKHRGFSLKLDGPLDMRMSCEGPTAEQFVNQVDENTLANIIYELGDEFFSKRIAKNIVLERSKNLIRTTGQLANIIRKSIPSKKSKIDAATKTFQAIRMYLNDEISELEQGLIAAEKMLKPEGVLAVVSFHSIEDRIIKRFFLKCAKNENYSRHRPGNLNKDNSLEIITKKPITPSQTEIKANKRSRSAKLRVAKRTVFPSYFGESA